MIALACDHGALDLKKAIMAHLDKRGLAYKDFGCYTKDSCDYPDFAGPAAQAVASGECDRGIVCCTTGIGPPHPRAQRYQHDGPRRSCDGRDAGAGDR